MAVGERFNDPDTQAAINAQASTAGDKPKEVVVEETSTEAPDQKPADEPVETPKPADTEAKPSESAPSDDADLDMSKVKAPSQEEVDKALADAGFSNEDLGKELAENSGKLSQETVNSLKEHFDPAAVDNAVKDLEAKFAEKVAEVTDEAEAATAKITEMNNYIYSELAGGDVAKGQENLKVLSDWAKANIDKATLDAINKKLASGDKTTVREGLETAVNLWKKGQVRPMMSGDPAATNNPKPEDKVEPLSRDAFIQIQMTKKYNEDPEYAAKIDARRRATMGNESFMTPEYNAKYRPAF